MIVLFVLLISILLFRGVGELGIPLFASWQTATRFGLAMMLLFTASAHFTRMKEDLIRMVPPRIPNPRAMVYFTGVCEILGAIGLIIPSLSKLTGLALILFFIALLPANIHAARAGVTLRGKPATPFWLRVPMQLLFIALTWWSTQR